ncbi:multidrug transporter [Escherichia coli O45:H2 str. 2010C-4211]|nr:multidrug transporter [Escherichia coli O121:H19 str. 2011C-3609]KDV51458.1 multidrug transporter [Escherichia coli O45:H2 str. 2010C-4211]
MPGSLLPSTASRQKYAAYGTDYDGEYQHVLLLHSTLPPNCLPSNKVFVFRYTPWA